MQVKYTEYNPVDVIVKDDNKDIKLATYRYHVPEGAEKKGVLFFVHGFGDYCG